MSPPTVLHVVLSLGTGGTERLVIDMCSRLQSRFGIAVCTLDEPGAWAGHLSKRGIDIISLRRRPGFHPSLGRRIADVARRVAARVIHCHHYSPFVYGRIATMLQQDLRLVFTEHGRLSDGPPSPKRRLVNPLLGQLPGALFAVSGALRASMIEEGFPAKRIGVVHNGIEPGPPPSMSERWEARAALGLDAGAQVIGTIARLDPVKDLGTLVHAFAHCARSIPAATLVVVGDGDERQALEHTALAHGVASRVRFLGQRDDARALLPAFDVYVNSSTSEGISLTLLEAMAAELPLVATRVGGTPEVVTDATGCLVPARDALSLATAIRELLLDPMRRRHMGVAGRQRVLRSFTLDRMVEHYAQVYLRMAS